MKPLIGEEAVRIGVPVVEIQGELYVNPHFGRSRRFAIIETTPSGYSVLEVFENEYADHMHGKRDMVVDLLYKKGVDAVIVNEIGHGAFTKLNTLGVKIYVVQRERNEMIKLKDAVEKLSKGMLEESDTPVEH